MKQSYSFNDFIFSLKPLTRSTSGYMDFWLLSLKMTASKYLTIKQMYFYSQSELSVLLMRQKKPTWEGIQRDNSLRCTHFSVRMVNFVWFTHFCRWKMKCTTLLSPLDSFLSIRAQHDPSHDETKRNEIKTDVSHGNLMRLLKICKIIKKTHLWIYVDYQQCIMVSSWVHLNTKHSSSTLIQLVCSEKRKYFK